MIDAQKYKKEFFVWVIIFLHPILILPLWLISSTFILPLLFVAKISGFILEVIGFDFGEDGLLFSDLKGLALWALIATPWLLVTVFLVVMGSMIIRFIHARLKIFQSAALLFVVMIFSSNLGIAGDENVQKWWEDLQKGGKGCVVVKVESQGRQGYYLVAGANRRMPLSYLIRTAMHFPSADRLRAEFDERIGGEASLIMGNAEVIIDDVEDVAVVELSVNDIRVLSHRG